MDLQKKLYKDFIKRYFNGELEFRAQIFNQLGMVGIMLGIITAIISAFTNAWVNVIINILISVITLIILHIANSTKKFDLCYTVTIIVVFFIAFPALFFTAGGYYSAMPCYFVFAIAFTALMLKGKKRTAIITFELLLYIGICLIAWRFPETVSMVIDKDLHFAVEIMSGFMLVGITLWIALIHLMRTYDQKQMQLEQLDKMKTEFLGNISHEIKTPVAVISSYAQTLRNDLQNIKEAERALSKSRLIVAECDRLSLLVSQMLDMARIDEGHMTMLMHETSIIEIIQDTMNAYGPVLNRNENQFVLNLDEDLPIVIADTTYISRVIINLLQNAVRHTKNGTITITAKANDRFIAVTISDTGEGISDNILPNLFERYKSKVHNLDKGISGIKYDTGTGLGLYICKYIVEAHGGIIKAESKPECGSSFTFTIPYHI